MRAIVFWFLCSLACTAQGNAQQRHAERTGGATLVSGHVYCADTNAPARMATVILQPAAALESIAPGGEKAIASRGDAVQTLLDGSFSMPRVAPGSYYVIATQAGYVSPVAALYVSGNRSGPEVEVRRKALESLPRVTVEPNLPVNVNVTIERGAAVSGSVTWDDGSPASGVRLSLLVRWKDKWIHIPSNPFERSSFSGGTDDQGEYRISGLPAGEYLLEAQLNLSKTSYNVDDQGSASVSMASLYSLSVYSGGKMRAKDAAPFTITAGEERRGEDLQIPLSRLHTVRGNLVAVRDGHVVNGGKIWLLYADDKSVAGQTSLSSDDDGFTFSFVPEGDYILRVEEAADNEYRHMPNDSKAWSPPRTETRTLRRYGMAEQRVQVLGEMAGLIVTVPDAQQTKAQSP